MITKFELFLEHFDEFFSDVTTGKRGTSDKEYKNFYDIDRKDIRKYVDSFKKHGLSNFNDHIAKSIPGHKEVQIITANAIVKMLKKKENSTVLDIGGSENTWSKTITESSNGRIKTTTLDPNYDMKKTSDKISRVQGNEYVTKAFMEPFDTYEKFDEKKFDVVHESMTLQFISEKRAKQIKYIKENLLKSGGIFITEEKLFNPKWNENEYKKDLYKSQYFDVEVLQKKAKDILKGGMNKNLIEKSKFENILKNNFDNYYMYWDGGNFFGYIASDKKIKIDKFKSLVHISRFDSVIDKIVKELEN
jgi:ubiquinone/menaquinone biosynthesis C-methylase UbiE